MTGLENPHRGSYTDDVEKLVSADSKDERSPHHPERLPAESIEVLPGLFQPRGMSLVFSPGRSEKHIDGLVDALRRGEELAPLGIVAFGALWVLIDGHHRLEAYRRSRSEAPIPVVVYESDRKGLQRVHWAEGLSVELNRKDKLPMSFDDKIDAAWRLTVSDGHSKSELRAITGVSDGTIGQMRRTRRELLELGKFAVDDLREWDWKRAKWELSRLKGEKCDDQDPDLHAKRVRHLIRKLTPIINRRTRLEVLRDALEALQPGICRSLGELDAINTQLDL